jgi:hypothetical protein
MDRYVYFPHELLTTGADCDPANRPEDDAGFSESTCLARRRRCPVALQSQWQKGNQAACPESWPTFHDTGLYVGESEQPIWRRIEQQCERGQAKQRGGEEQSAG